MGGFVTTCLIICAAIVICGDDLYDFRDIPPRVWKWSKNFFGHKRKAKKIEPMPTFPPCWNYLEKDDKDFYRQNMKLAGVEVPAKHVQGRAERGYVYTGGPGLVPTHYGLRKAPPKSTGLTQHMEKLDLEAGDPWQNSLEREQWLEHKDLIQKQDRVKKKKAKH